MSLDQGKFMVCLMMCCEMGGSLYEWIWENNYDFIEFRNAEFAGAIKDIKEHVQQLGLELGQLRGAMQSFAANGNVSLVVPQPGIMGKFASLEGMMLPAGSAIILLFCFAGVIILVVVGVAGEFL